MHIARLAKLALFFIARHVMMEVAILYIPLYMVTTRYMSALVILSLILPGFHMLSWMQIPKM